MNSRAAITAGAGPLWQRLANWLALLTLIALGMLAPGARAAIPAAGAGTLLLKSAPDAAALPALRQETSMHATVTGSVARVEVTQRFSNGGECWMEGLYVFPLPEGSAVDELTLKIGERTLVGEIRERAAAHAAYEQARREGRQASLIDQERPNMFATAVANIPPGAAVEVHIAYLEVIAYREGRYTLHLPLAITPRYTPATQASGSVLPQTPEAVSAAAQRVAISVDLAPGFALAEVRSHYHAVSESPLPGGERVRLASDSAPADRDFELTWTPQLAPDTQAAAFAERAGEDAYVLLTVTPPAFTSAPPPREVIFIIDTSGSMEGPSIEQARAALALGVERLSAADHFNIIRFSSDASQLFASSQPVTPASRAAAARFIGALTAGGGTEMRPALERAFATAPLAEALRQIVFITDGSVGNEDELVRLIHARIGAARLFTVGIGAAPNGYFMRAAATAGRGSYTFIGNRAEVQERMGALFAKLEQPALTDLALSWPGGAAAELAAPLPADVYAGDPLVVAARVPRLSTGLLTLSGTAGAHAWVRQLPLTVVSAQAGVGKLWARERIAELSAQRGLAGQDEATRQAIVGLALAHHLVSEFTSLVAVDVTPVRAAGAPLAAEQLPTSAPQGSYWASSTGFPRTASAAPLLILVGLSWLTLAVLLAGAARLRAPRP